MGSSCIPTALRLDLEMVKAAAPPGCAAAAHSLASSTLSEASNSSSPPRQWCRRRLSPPRHTAAAAAAAADDDDVAVPRPHQELVFREFRDAAPSPGTPDADATDDDYLEELDFEDEDGFDADSFLAVDDGVGDGIYSIMAIHPYIRSLMESSSVQYILQQ
uniref:Uncharacterized protein n=1 Tax=Oryza meridionalis TaxID=40149 RepID=A0A0E0ERC7_9ORYZ